MMKRIVYLAVAALVAMMLLVPSAFAQGEMTVKQKFEGTAPLPPSGGPAVSTLVLPAAALLIGSGVLAYAVLRRRQ